MIFAPAGLVDEAQRNAAAAGASPRPTLEDVWSGRIRADELPLVDSVIRDSGRGYKRIENLLFTWDEARLMEKSGTIAVAGHSMFHDGVFTAAVWDGFVRPADALASLPREPRGAFWGRPRFATAAALTGKAFIPDADLLERLRSSVPQNEAEAFAFFEQEKNIQGLNRIMDSFAGRLGYTESDKEQRERMFQAMRDNQALLSRELGHAVRSFRWPWGKYGDLALEAGKAAGFSVFYTVNKGPNPPGRPLAVRRMDCRRNPDILLSRIGTYARPVIGGLYAYYHARIRPCWHKDKKNGRQRR